MDTIWVMRGGETSESRVPEWRWHETSQLRGAEATVVAVEKAERGDSTSVGQRLECVGERLHANQSSGLSLDAV